MKSIFKTLAVALALILAFSAVLIGGAYALALSPTQTKEYSRNDFVDENLFIKENAPLSQSDMQKKFAEYSITEHVDGGTAQIRLTHFTKEQAQSLKARKDGGERFTLSYDEILFIIGDSTQGYFNNTHIVLTNAASYGLIYSERMQKSADHHITCYHGDFSEFEYNTAIQKYNEMIADIYDIIIYRIAMLDSDFLSGDLVVTESGEPYFNDTDGQYKKSFDNTKKDNYRNFLASELYNYTKKVEASLSGYYKPDDLAVELKALMLFANYSVSSEKMIYTVETDCLTQTPLYPTAELIAMRPVIGETKPQNNRSFFEGVAGTFYPEYDSQTPTQNTTDDFLKAINEERLKGMTFKELVDTFGLPYNGATSGLCTGCYYPSDGGMIVIYFDSDFNVTSYEITE